MQFDETPKPMKQLGELFERYAKILQPPQRIVEETAIVIIKEVTSYTIARSQVRYVVNTKVLYLQVPGILRSEILFHRPIILKMLSERLGERGAPKSLL